MDTPTLLTHLQTHDRPLTLPRGGALHWDDAARHAAARAAAPGRYAVLGLAPGVVPWQRARVLLQILTASQAGLRDDDRAVLAAAAHRLAHAVPPGHVITALLALRRLRANHKHTTRAVLRFVLEHPDADVLIAARRAALADCFEHALGTATARGCARRVAAGDTGSDYLRRRLLRFLADPAAALPRVTALYTADAAPGVAAGLPAHPPRPLPPDPPGPFPGDLTLVLHETEADPAARHLAAALRTALGRTCPRLAVRSAPAPDGASDGVPDGGGVLVTVEPGGDGTVVHCRPRTGPDDDAEGRALTRTAELPGLAVWIAAHAPAGPDWLHDALRDRLAPPARPAGTRTDAAAGRPFVN
ncbi:hypothetical protein [Actinomadura atramentaria]|uniref:hypothetical protein n=1 Tax=Actinomadura atramentaria TaxID=1990 RepID=UPI00035E89EC|nr:hypothetical protein [Actinomadura atramentaria]